MFTTARLQYGTMKRQRQICVGLFQRNITSGKLTITFNKLYIFLKIKARIELYYLVQLLQNYPWKIVFQTRIQR
jgi:hypothetical protein